MGEAVDKPPTPSTSEVAAAAAGLADDFLKFLDEPFSVLNGDDDKQGKKEGVEVLKEEEEEELEWLSNKDAFPTLDTSLTFGPISVSDTSDALEALENVVVDEVETDEVDEGETGVVRVPKKRRSPVQRRPRQVFTDHPSQWVTQNKKEKPTSGRRCTHCGVAETPQWRQGPEGPSTLCNACGVRYKSGRLFDEYRPANSPTFCPEKHSNIHRKVVEIREGKQADGGVNSNTKYRHQSRFGGNEHGGEPDGGGGLGT